MIVIPPSYLATISKMSVDYYFVNCNCGFWIKTCNLSNAVLSASCALIIDSDLEEGSPFVATRTFRISIEISSTSPIKSL